jgi:YesN/AraC family two-component response regulator
MIEEGLHLEIVEYLKSIDLNQISIIDCIHIDQTSNKWVFTEHSHFYMEMIYFLKGKAHINVGDSSVNTSIYDVIVYLPEQRHQEEVDLTNNQEVICIGIDIQLNKPIDQSSFKLCDRAGILRWLFEQIHREYRSKNRTSSYLTKIYAQAVILQFIKHLDRRTMDSEEEVMERIQNYIQQNLSTTITPPQLAAMGHISKSYLHRLFKKHLQTTPVHYINQIRISAAQSLLLDTTYSIRDIAQSVGFEDVNYFSRVFKRLTGTTPSKFKGSHKISNFK